MRAGFSSGGGGSGGFSGAPVIVILVLMLGAIVYLWRARYLRRRTAYVLMAILVLLLIGAGLSTHHSGA